MPAPPPSPTCRICFETRAEIGGTTRLISPCQCKGSLKWICVGCFRSCRLYSDAPNRCGVCLCPYTERHVEMVTPTLAEAEARARAAREAVDDVFRHFQQAMRPLREAHQRARRELDDVKRRQRQRRQQQRARSRTPVPNRNIVLPRQVDNGLSFTDFLVFLAFCIVVIGFVLFMRWCFGTRRDVGVCMARVV